MGLIQFLTSMRQQTRQNSVICYHCDERVAQRRVVRSLFHGEVRELCCHGCATVLLMVETNGLIDDYLKNKSHYIQNEA